MAGVSEYISKVTKAQMKELLIQYQNNMQQKGNPGYYMGKLNEDGTKATLVDGTTVDIITKGLPGSYAPVYLIGGGKGLVDQEEPYTENIDQDTSKAYLGGFISNGFSKPLSEAVTYIGVLDLIKLDSYIFPIDWMETFPSNLSFLKSPDGYGYYSNSVEYESDKYAGIHSPFGSTVDALFPILFFPQIVIRKNYRGFLDILVYTLWEKHEGTEVNAPRSAGLFWTIFKSVQFNRSQPLTIVDGEYFIPEYESSISGTFDFTTTVETSFSPPPYTHIDYISLEEGPFAVSNLDFYIDDQGKYHLYGGFLQRTYTNQRNVTTVVFSAVQCGQGPGNCNFFPDTNFMLLDSQLTTVDFNLLHWQEATYITGFSYEWGRETLEDSVTFVPDIIGCNVGEWYCTGVRPEIVRTSTYSASVQVPNGVTSEDIWSAGDLVFDISDLNFRVTDNLIITNTGDYIYAVWYGNPQTGLPSLNYYTRPVNSSLTTKDPRIEFTGGSHYRSDFFSSSLNIIDVSYNENWPVALKDYIVSPLTRYDNYFLHYDPTNYRFTTLTGFRVEEEKLKFVKRITSISNSNSSIAVFGDVLTMNNQSQKQFSVPIRENISVTASPGFFFIFNGSTVLVPQAGGQGGNTVNCAPFYTR